MIDDFGSREPLRRLSKEKRALCLARHSVMLDNFEDEIDRIFESDEAKDISLHTQISQTGYQPYGVGQGVGSVAETCSFGPARRQRSRSSGSRGSSRGSGSDLPECGSVALTAPAGSSSRSYQDLQKELQVMQATLQEHGIPIPEVMRAESLASSSGLPRPLFREAEAKIIQKGREVAEKVVEVQKMEHQAKLQQEATAQSWERTQQREEASNRMFEQGKQVQREVEQVKAAVVAEVQAIQSQVASENDRISQSQLAVDAERRRILDIQAEVEKQVAAKQQEFTEKEARLTKEAEQIAQIRAESDQRVAQVVLEFEARSAAAQMQIEKEREQRLSMEKRLVEAMQVVHSRPEIFQMDVDDEVPASCAARQIQTDQSIAMGLAEEIHKQALTTNQPMCGNVALTAAADLAGKVESGRGKEDHVQAALLQQNAAILEMMQSMRKDIDEMKANSNRGSSRNSEGNRSRQSSDSEFNFSLSSSIRETLQGVRGSPGNHEDPVAVRTASAAKQRKELDEVKGIPAYPTTAEYAGWKREARYAVAAASVQPERALRHVLKAEKWRDDILKLPRNLEFETLEVKFGKALKAILRGDAKRELSNLEERVLREQGRLLNGTEIYAWIVRQFERDLKLARPQVLRELALIKLGSGRNALRNFKAKWDAGVERLVGIGDTKETDEEILYVYFREQFLLSEDMADSVAKVRRSPPSSSVHSYRWMYAAVEARLETMRLEEQEKERIAAYRPDSGNPMTPGIEVAKKGRGKGKPERDTSKEACQRMLKDGKCQFENRCWFSHEKAVLDQARKRKGTKKLCAYYQAGRCLKEDQCDFSHEIPEQNGAAEVAIGSVAVSVVAHQVEQDKGSESIQGSSGSVAETAAPGCNKMSEEDCVSYVLAAAHVSNAEQIDSEIDEFLRELTADFKLARKLEKDLEEVLKLEQGRGSVAETAPNFGQAKDKGLLQLPPEVNERTKVGNKRMRKKSKKEEEKRRTEAQGGIRSLAPSEPAKEVRHPD